MLNNEQLIDKTIEFLNQVRDVRCNIKVEGPNIEEIFGTPDELYGKAKMNIEIIFDDLYKKTNDLFGTWKKVNKDESEEV